MTDNEDSIDIESISAEEKEAIDIENGKKFLSQRISFKEIADEKVESHSAFRMKRATIETVKRLASEFSKEEVYAVIPAQYNQPSYIVQTIDPAKLVISKVTQRDINWEDVAKRVGDNYVGSATQHITVVLNNVIPEIKGKYFVVDGQHTACLRYIQGIPLVCNVIISEEANTLKFSQYIGELFRNLNNRKKVSGWDLGKAKAVSGDPAWMEIVNVFNKYERFEGGNSPKEKGELSRLTTFKKCYDAFGGITEIENVLQFSKFLLKNAAMSGMIFASLVTLFYELKLAGVEIDHYHLSSIFKKIDDDTDETMVSRKLDKLIQERARSLSVDSVYNRDFGYNMFSNHTGNFITGRVYAIIDMYNETAHANGVDPITPFRLSKDQYSL